MSDLLETLNEHARRFPARPALIGGEEIISYGDMPEAIAEKADLLAEEKCRCVGLQMDNGPEWILWDLAAVKAGVASVPLPPFFTPAQVQHVVQSTGIDHMIEEGRGLGGTGAPLAAAGIPEGTSKITFTSGTTGTPKGVCLSQTGLEQVAQSIVGRLGDSYAGFHLSIMPLAILLENVAGVYAALFAGATCHLYALEMMGMGNPFQPDFLQLLSVMKENAISSAILVPELLRGLMGAVAQSGDVIPLPALKFLAVGGSKVAPELVRGARAMGLPVYEGYGLSECGSVVSMNVPDADGPETVGKLLPHVDARIEDGEVVVQNPAFLGYIGQPHQGAFATGDLGRFDENGFLYIEGRKKNVLITSHGRNISPEWLESVLLAQPEIAQAIVYGDALPYPGALIVPVAGDVDVFAAVDRANKALPEYAQMKTIHAVSPFTVQDGTLTGTGRPRRNAIFEKYKTILEEKSHEFL